METGSRRSRVTDTLRGLARSVIGIRSVSTPSPCRAALGCPAVFPAPTGNPRGRSAGPVGGRAAALQPERDQPDRAGRQSRRRGIHVARDPAHAGTAVRGDGARAPAHGRASQEQETGGPGVAVSRSVGVRADITVRAVRTAAVSICTITSLHDLSVSFRVPCRAPAGSG
jgi:hypothetical protein